MSQPKTAAEALLAYLGILKYAGDDPMVSPREVFYLAHEVTKFAQSEGLDLAMLVPDEKVRSGLIADAEEDKKEIEENQSFLDEMNVGSPE